MVTFRAAVLTLIVTVGIGCDFVWAQLPSVVQLPSFQTFSYSGSALVPDGGSTSLGGVRSSAIGSRRAPGRRAFGAMHSNSQVSLRATIIDLNEMDRQILGADPKQRVRGGEVQRTRKANQVEEGKALVRFARQQYRSGKRSESFVTYQMAIGVLDGRLRNLAVVEFRRVFGASAEQSLRMARTLR